MTDGDGDPPVVLVEGGLDFLTVTAPWEHSGMELLHFGRELATNTQTIGNKLRPWQWYGYVGEISQDVAYGQRRDGVLLRVAGGLSHLQFTKIARLADKCSRIDLQATAKSYDPNSHLVKTSYAEAEAASTARGTPLDVSMILNNRGGSTLYLGSRVSELFGRLYNKGKQSNDPQYQDCWRWEVEYKGDCALAVFRQLQATPPHPATCTATIHKYFEDRGVAVPWHPASSVTLKTPSVPRTDDARRLAWLGSQVRDVVEDLSERVDRGEIARVLGLAPEATKKAIHRAKWVSPTSKIRKEVNGASGGEC